MQKRLWRSGKCYSGSNWQVAILDVIDSFVWGLPLIVLLLGTGLYLTIILGGLQFRYLFYALRLAFITRDEESAEGDISHYQALMTALSATVGTGNIAGVATAIAVGGPGAVFWMWMTGLVGMVTKYAEALLAVKYRYEDEKGEMVGGPMVYIRAIGEHRIWQYLATLFALFTVVASFGIGNMVQSNSVASAMHKSFNMPELATGIILALLTSMVIIGGVKSIGRVASLMVPLMIVAYVVCAMTILVINMEKIPSAFMLIINSAFTGSAAVGGFAGSAIWVAVRMGVARGIFSNESGLGSAAIIASAARTKEPSAQALVSMTQTFIDTIIVCSMTALVILVTDSWQGGANGAELTSIAFGAGLGETTGPIIVSLSLAVFAYSTLLGWSYYGEKGIESMLGLSAVLWYRIVFVLFIIVGAVLKLSFVWTFSDIANGLMAFPNLVALLLLSPVVVKESRKFLSAIRLKNE